MPRTRASAVNRNEKRKAVLSPRKEPPKVPKIEREEKPDLNIESDDSDLENYEIDYAKRREENLRLNQEFLEKFGVTEAKDDFRAVQKTSIRKPTQRGLKREKIPAEILPRRSSLRLQNKTPEGIDLPPEALIQRASYTPYQPEEHTYVRKKKKSRKLSVGLRSCRKTEMAVKNQSVVRAPKYPKKKHLVSLPRYSFVPQLRPPAGPLDMKEHLYTTSHPEDHGVITSLVGKLDTKPIKPSTTDLDSVVSELKKTRLTEVHVAKAVPNRSFSVAIHPSSSKVLVATGGKWGKLGLWNVDSTTESGSDGVCCYTPHSRPINWLEFPVTQPEKLYSCSYDGTLRCGDLRKEVFEEVYSLPEENDVLLRNLSFTSPFTMLVSQSDGCVAVVDTRTDSVKAEHTYSLQDRPLRSVSVHPTQQHYFCTAGVDGSVSVWDCRNLKEKKNKSICRLPHGRSVNSAYFSPLTGQYILSTSMDDKLTIFDTSTISSDIKIKKSISHNNHTGRWLTNFRAMWHPSREDLFVVGSMNRPREISFFSTEGRKVLSLTDEEFLGSVCSLNVIHPSRNIVVGVNSSGRLHLFM